MKAVKHLYLKKTKPEVLYTHSSCVIDEGFMKYCHKRPKKKTFLTKAKKALIEKKKKKMLEEKKRLPPKRLKTEVPSGDKTNDELLPLDDPTKDLDAEEEEEKKRDEKYTKIYEEKMKKYNEKAKRRILDIKAIEFDWIF